MRRYLWNLWYALRGVRPATFKPARCRAAAEALKPLHIKVQLDTTEAHAKIEKLTARMRQAVVEAHGYGLDLKHPD
jgi:hypothetical protein